MTRSVGAPQYRVGSDQSSVLARRSSRSSSPSRSLRSSCSSRSSSASSRRSPSRARPVDAVVLASLVLGRRHRAPAPCGRHPRRRRRLVLGVLLRRGSASRRRPTAAARSVGRLRRQARVRVAIRDDGDGREPLDDGRTGSGSRTPAARRRGAGPRRESACSTTRETTRWTGAGSSSAAAAPTPAATAPPDSRAITADRSGAAARATGRERDRPGEHGGQLVADREAAACAATASSSASERRERRVGERVGQVVVRVRGHRRAPSFVVRRSLAASPLSARAPSPAPSSPQPRCGPRLPRLGHRQLTEDPQEHDRTLVVRQQVQELQRRALA